MEQTQKPIVAGVLAEVSYKKDWFFHVAPDESFLQVRFFADHAPQHGRRWWLSEHMTRSEIVQTALMAVLAAEEHEVREHFRYRGAAIFGPHFDVDQLHLLAQSKTSLDVRKPPHRPLGCGNPDCLVCTSLALGGPVVQHSEPSGD
jgi:hypothetical protein